MEPSVERRILWAGLPLPLEVPEEMCEATTDVLNGRYDAPYYGEKLTILDIGANVGAFSLWANFRWPESRIYAYEPQPDTFELLQRNVRAYPNIRCINRAVYPSDREREPFYSRYAGDGESGLVTVVSKMFAELPSERIFEVPVISPKSLPEADIVKIDTEGAEVSILSSMDLENVSLILLEYHFGEDREALTRLLEPVFSLECETAFEWSPLLVYEEYRPSLAGDSYGQLCFVNTRLRKLRAYNMAAPTQTNGSGPSGEPGANLADPTALAEAAPPPVEVSNQPEPIPARPAAAPHPQTAGKRSLSYLYDLLATLVNRDMKLRYKRSVLGIAWSLLNPLAQLLVFGFIFHFILPMSIPNYTVFLFIGILAWNWFQSALNQATGAIVENGELIRYPGFPVMVLPIVSVTSHLIHFLIALPILILFMILSGVAFSGALLALPLVITLQFFLSLSLAYLVATLHVTFRDTQYLLGIALMLGFFLTPIFYSMDEIPEQLTSLYQLNPMLHLINAYRSIFLTGTFPEARPLLILGAVCLGLLWIGYRAFSRASNHFVEEI
jgi:lipopolysaccharide transport system permease protein